MHKAIISGSMLWSNITKMQGHSTINQQIKSILYNWILQHPQFVESPIANNSIKLSIDDQVETQLVHNVLLQVSFREIHNRMVSPLDEGEFKEARYAENNIIISG